MVMTHLRHILSGLLVAVIVLTGGAMASARGQAMAVGEMVLCTGTGPVSVPVDADGKPTGPPHICPDCALSLFAADLPDTAQAARPIGAAPCVFVSVNAVRTGVTPVSPNARGPPLA